MFALLFIVGLGLSSLTADRLARGGLDQTEAIVLGGQGSLILAGLIMLTAIRLCEVRVLRLREYNRAKGLAAGECFDDDLPDIVEAADPGQAPKGARPDRRTTPGAPGAASSGAGAQPHTLTRTWSARPDQKLPSGDDEPGTPEKIQQVRVRATPEETDGNR